MSIRRARRIDVWRDPVDGTIMIDSGFQDSAGHPDHGRIAVHEYVAARHRRPRHADHHVGRRRPPGAAVPVVPERRRAPPTIVVGTPLAELRTTVLERLARTNGCTHLNDALRALAEVPVLLGQLDTELASADG